MSKSIFVAGIHGVGKTYLCESVAHLGLKFASASSIIKSELSDSNWNKDKVVSDADRNQAALLLGVEKIKRAVSPQSLLLDGHFVLRTQNGFLSLDHTIFEALNLDAVLLIEDDPEIIAARLQSRYSVNAPKDLKEFNLLERAQAEKFSVDKGVPLFVVKSGDTESFSQIVKNII